MKWEHGSCRQLLVISELTQQDGRGKRTANLVWQPWQFCLKNLFSKLYTPLNRSFCKRPENIEISEDRSRQNTQSSNSSVTSVIHERLSVLFFLSSCCVNSLLTPWNRSVWTKCVVKFSVGRKFVRFSSVNLALTWSFFSSSCIWWKWRPHFHQPHNHDYWRKR